MFLAGKVIWAMASPGGFLVLLLLAGLVLPRRHHRLSRALIAAGALGFLAITILPLDRWALAPLENRFPRPEPPAHVDGIIVLGGAVSPSITRARGIPSLNGAAERMTGFLELARRYPDAKLVFAGGSGSTVSAGLSEADVARQFFAAQGLDTARIIFESQSSTTRENALFAQPLARPAPGETWILVTSALHIPRAVGVFRALGWDVLPWPVAYKADPVWTIELDHHLLHLDAALHEWAGLVAYRLMGWSSAWFPAPAP